MAGVEMRAGAGDAPAVLALMGDVGREIAPDAVQRALAGVAGKPIVVHLHSYGGDALAGVAIHNMLARHDGAKTVIVEGIAASAASLIAMAGERIVMPDNAFLMIHEAWSVAMGPADLMRKEADLLDMVSAAYRRTYAARTGKDEDEIGRMMAEETWMTAADAVAQGFATETAAPIEVRASAGELARFHRVPEALRALSAPVNPPAEPARTQEVRVTEITAKAGDEPAVITAAAPMAATLEQVEMIAAKAKLGAEFVLAQVRAKATIEAVRDAALEALVADRPKPSPARVDVLRDEGDTKRAQLAAAFAYKIGADRNLPDMAADWRGARWLDIARACVEMAGGRCGGMAPTDIARAALNLPGHRISGMATTSDFPGLLGNNMSKRLLAAYDNASEARNFLRFAYRRTLPDFKTARTVEVGMGPSLAVVPEGATVTYGTMGEFSETYALATYSRRQVLSYQALVNDDLGAFDRLPQAWANSAANMEASVTWGLFNTNAALSDSVAWFNATHANTTAGALSIANIGVARAGVRAQTDATGQRILITPTVLIVPPGLETEARALLAPQVVPSAASVTNVNPWVGAFGEPVVGHYLTDTNDYYVTVASGSGFEPIEVAYLEGEEAPMVESFTDAAVLGVTTRCTHHFAAKVATFRTIHRMTA
jgi:ATP-dependent protease ClpP protease subunit